MARPYGYKHTFVALHSIPYTEGDGSAYHNEFSGGVLGAGELVWANHLHQSQPSRVTAFVESVGVVSLDPRWLVTPELYQSSQR